MSDPQTLPETVGGYAIERELGQGGMGRVYLGRHEGLDRLVALKVLQPKLADEPEFVDRFLREARAAAKFSHPNVVTVFDTGIDDKGVHFIAFEFVHGGTAEDLLERQGKISPETVVRIALGVAEALAFAESKGIVHRDVKPENILLTPEGVPKLADLGLAKQIESNEGTNLTQTGMVLGTPLYMSPEQALGDPLDIRSDLYALGLVMWRMLTGLVPFDEDRSASSLQIINRHINQDLPDVRGRVPEAPADLAHVIGQLAAREPEDRYASAQAAVTDLRALRDGKPLVSGGPGDPNTTQPPTGMFADSNPAHDSPTGVTPPPPASATPAPGARTQATTPTLAMDQMVLRPRQARGGSTLPFLAVLALIGAAVAYAIYTQQAGPTEASPPPTQTTTPPPPPPQQPPDEDPVPEFAAEVGPRERIGRLASELRGSLKNLRRAERLVPPLREQIARLYEDEHDSIDEGEEIVLFAFEQLLDALGDFAPRGPSAEDLFRGSVTGAVGASDDSEALAERCKAISQVIYELDAGSSDRLERGLLEACERYDADAIEGLLTRLPLREGPLGELQAVALDVAAAHVLRGYARTYVASASPPAPPNWLADPRPALGGETLFQLLEVSRQLHNAGVLSAGERDRLSGAVQPRMLELEASLLGALTRPVLAPIGGVLQVRYPDNTPIGAAMAYAAAVEHTGEVPSWLKGVEPLPKDTRQSFVGGAAVFYLPQPPVGSQTLEVTLSDERDRTRDTRVLEASRLTIQGGGYAPLSWPTPAWVTVRVRNGVMGVVVSQGLGHRPVFATALRLPQALSAVARVQVQGDVRARGFTVDELALPAPTWNPATVGRHPDDERLERLPPPNQTETKPPPRPGNDGQQPPRQPPPPPDGAPYPPPGGHGHPPPPPGGAGPPNGGPGPGPGGGRGGRRR